MYSAKIIYSNSPQLCRPTEGFTLIEALIAIAVSAMVLGGVAVALGDSFKNIQYAGQKIAADIAARNLIDRHKLQLVLPEKHWPELKYEQGEVEQGGYRLAYTQTITPGAVAGFKRVDIRVEDPESNTLLRELNMFAGEK